MATLNKVDRLQAQLMMSQVNMNKHLDQQKKLEQLIEKEKLLAQGAS